MQTKGLGFVSLVGAGPGDPGLLTRTAAARLRAADLVLYDALVDGRILRLARRAQRFFVGKRAGRHALSQQEIHALMIRAARRGRRIVRLKGGDPFVFGRGGEECDALREAGMEVDVVGGLTAGIAGPASIGIPVTDRRFTRGVALVTGHSGSNGECDSEPDWSALVQSRLTLVIYMGVSRWPHIARALHDAGMPGDMPAAVVCSAHTAQQRQALCTLDELAHTMQAEQLTSPALVVLGDVVQASPLWRQRSLSAAASDAESPLCCKRHISA